MLDGLFEDRGCGDFQFSGAYRREMARKRGLSDKSGRPDRTNLALFEAGNELETRLMDERS